MKTKSILYSILLIVAFIFHGCDTNRVYDTNTAIDNGIWNKDDHKIFNPLITKSKTSHNVYINVRNTNNYAFSNLYLFLRITSPTGNVVIDTFNCVLADDKGKWFGSGIGDLFYYQVPYKQNIFFPDTGVYTFEFEQAMRVDDLQDITDIGLRIEIFE